MAELMLGQPLFPGESGIDQLVEIIKVLGTPTREQIKTMNPNVCSARGLPSQTRLAAPFPSPADATPRPRRRQYMEHKFPQIRPHPFSKVFRPRSPSSLAFAPLRTFLLTASHPLALILLFLLPSPNYKPTQTPSRSSSSCSSTRPASA